MLGEPLILLEWKYSAIGTQIRLYIVEYLDSVLTHPSALFNYAVDWRTNPLIIRKKTFQTWSLRNISSWDYSVMVQAIVDGVESLMESIRLEVYASKGKRSQLIQGWQFNSGSSAANSSTTCLCSSTQTQLYFRMIRRSVNWYLQFSTYFIRSFP